MQLTEQSPSNLAVVRGAYDAWARGDLDTLVEAFSEDVEIQPFLGGSLGASTYHGHAGVRSWYADANDAWERLDVELDELLDGGDTIIVSMRAVGVGKGSHVEVEARILHVIRLEDGKVVYLKGYDDRGTALRAAGMAN